jgi:hypothetical protein
MIDEPPSAVEALFGAEAHEQAVRMDRRRREECWLILLTCYSEVLEKLYKNRNETARFFEEFAKFARTLVPKRGRGAGRKNVASNAQIEEARLAAQTDKENAVLTAICAGTIDETALRQGRRLDARRRQHDQVIKEAAATVIAAVRTGNRDAIVASFEEAGRIITAGWTGRPKRTNNLPD